MKGSVLHPPPTDVFRIKHMVNHKLHTNRCKIIGTLGPASSTDEVLEKIMLSGLDIVRLNFSHGNHQTHIENIERIRRLSKKLNLHIAILQDLQGPKIRCGKLLNHAIKLLNDHVYTLCFGYNQKELSIIPIDYRDLAKDVKPGQKVMMDDGLLALSVEEIQGQSVIVRVIEGGILKSRKGVNFPDTILSLPAMTEKDRRDLFLGIENRVDFIALSFVQSPMDIQYVKEMIRAMGSDIPIIAKIEKLSAIETINELAEVSDGLMVARGDLGVEGKVERVPGFQRKIIAAAIKYAKPVIIATQMLESMTQHPQATLAEIADVANGVLDGADCLMLSGEMAAGKYPVTCVQKMASIIAQVESWQYHRPARYDEFYKPQEEEKVWDISEAIARAACEAADSISAKMIVSLSLTGLIARMIARWRPKTPILALSPRKEIVQRLSIVSGVHATQNPFFYNTETLLQNLPAQLKKLNLAKTGDIIIITAGVPINEIQPTNMIKISRIT